MLSIVLYGDLKDDTISKLILNNISKNFNICHIKNDTIRNVGIGKELLLIETDRISTISLDNFIIIFKNDYKIKNLKYISNNNIAIVNSNNLYNINNLFKLNLKPITCGFSAKDTVTFSSNSLDNCVISLQRSIVNFTNKEVEPFEIPVEIYKDIENYDLLAYVALLIFMDQVDQKIKILTPKNFL